MQITHEEIDRFQFSSKASPVNDLFNNGRRASSARAEVNHVDRLDRLAKIGFFRLELIKRVLNYSGRSFCWRDLLDEGYLTAPLAREDSLTACTEKRWEAI